MGLLFGIILGLFILVLLVVVHEIGHGIVARRNSVVVEEFGVGFPPLAWGKKVAKSFLGKNVLYSVNWLPLGGFVRLKGEYDSATVKGGYGAASYWVKTKVLFAGVVMNWLVAIVLFTILALTGMPKIIENQFTVPADTRITQQGSADVTVSQVVDGSPAAQAGIKNGDVITAVAGTDVTSAAQFVSLTKEYKGQNVTIAYTRGDQAKQVAVQLRDGGSGGYLGVGASGGAQEVVHATWSAPIVGVGTTVQLTWVTLQGLGGMVANLVTGLVDQLSVNEQTRQQGSESLATVSNSVAGPVGILGVIFPEAGRAGLTTVIFLTAIISLSLAVMNTLPIPALDGGRWTVMTIYKLRGKVLTKEREESIQGAGMMVLFGLIILITIADIGKVVK
ncbi:PDZ domain-containing protein [Candidatus Mycosynbacter amalyticus]|uniref:PDZ domain-containing protein n=1 Tax=Candidatus Mycosynbacter amalyticus TaxID=2665156 RepID=A0A857MSW0_9BACT|nr:M50 family metallopeptidase [Candidatus Mycosynbacter amalyticus]QHN42527.1 PDZ domain-containing protein [Candidatus Mycosynbacter amalyticus]